MSHDLRFYDQCIFCTLEAISQRYPNYLKSIKCKSHEKGEKKKSVYIYKIFI